MSLVSILVPVYNVEACLSRCLESLIRQTYKNIEIVLINDGTLDSSDDIARFYAQRYDFVHLYEYSNAGISVTRNRALSHAHGEYVMFVDSDDTLEHNAIEHMMSYMKEHQCDVVTCGYTQDYKFFSLYRKVSPKGVLTTSQALHSLVDNTGVNNYPWGKLYKKSCFENVSFPEGVRGFEDTYTVFKALLNAKRIGTLPNRYYHYIQRRGSLTNRMDLETVYGMRKAYEYQEQVLHQMFPNEEFVFDMHYYNSDMVILYTLMCFYSRKDAPVYVPASINWKHIHPIFRLGYKIFLWMVSIKFGWTKDEQEAKR